MRSVRKIGCMVCLLGFVAGPVLAEATADDAKKSDAKTVVAAKEGTEPKEVKRATVVRLTIRGSYPEGPASMGLFGGMTSRS